MSTFAATIDAIGRVMADAVDGHVFAAGVTVEATGAAPELVPIADDFTEGGFPVVTVALGPWQAINQPGNQRVHIELRCAVWRARVPLGESASALYDDLQAIDAALSAHTKAYRIEPTLQSALLTGGPGIVPRTVPSGSGERTLLTLPFTIDVVLAAIVVLRPA